MINGVEPRPNDRTEEHAFSGIGILAAIVSWSLISGTLVSCGSSSSGPAKHVVIITMDTTRPDHLSCYGYGQETSPNLDDLAERGALFLNAYSSNPVTLPSHATIMTGTYPFYHGVRDNGLYSLDDANVTLAERLKDEGFHTGAVLAAGVLRARYGLDQGFDFYDTEVRTGFSPTGHIPERSAKEVTDRALEWVEKQPDGRLFLWVHYFDPHAPYTSPEPFASQFPGTGENPWFAGYDAEIAYMDAEIGRLLDGLDDLDLLDDTLVVATADHGEGFEEHGELTHGLTLYEECVKVPLIFSGPGIAHARIDDVVRTIDIVPTVLEALSFKPESQEGRLHGLNLIPRLTSEEPLQLDAYLETYTPETTFGWSWLEAIRKDTPPVKYIDAPNEELYRLDQDEDEFVNRHEDDATTSDKARDALAKLKVELGAANGPLSGPIELTGEAQAELASLGYIGSANLERSEERGPDPKDVMPFLVKKERAAERLNAGDFDGAEALFREFLSAVPKKTYAYEMLALTHSHRARALEKQGRDAEARVQIEKSIESFMATVDIQPNYVIGRYNLAMAYGHLGDSDEKNNQLRACLAIDPHFIPALYFLGRVHFERGEWEQALELFDRQLARFRPREGVVELEGADAKMLSGVCLVRLDRVDEGLARLEEAKRLAPQWPEPEYWKGKIAFDRGEKSKARQSLTLYLRSPNADPQNASRARRLLGRLNR